MLWAPPRPRAPAWAGFVPPGSQAELWDGVCALSKTLVVQGHMLDTAVCPKASGLSPV